MSTPPIRPSALEPPAGSDGQHRFPPGTFTADPAASAPARRITATAGLELRLTLRNGEQVLLSLIIPLAALIGGTLIRLVTLPEPRIASVLPGVLVLAVFSAAFTSQAITTGFDRRYGVLKRLAAAGVGRAQLIAGKCAATLAVIAGQCLVLFAAALLLGWQPSDNASLSTGLWAALVILLGTATFVGLALLLGGTLRAEGVLAVANLLWLVFVLIGGVVVPLSTSPEVLRRIGELTPPGAMTQALRAVVQDGTPPSVLALLVLTGWLIAGWVATVRWFRWQ